MDHQAIAAAELAQRNQATLPGESADYRKARNALLAEEIELRRHIERVACLRRELPPGGEVSPTRRSAYRFEGERGSLDMEALFDGKPTLIIYSFMYGPLRQKPCPMCTSVMNAWDGTAPAIEARVAFAMVARSPLARLAELKRARGWRHLKLYSDLGGDYTRDYVSAQDADMPGYNVFMCRDGVIRHFWGAEMSGEMADPGQDPRGAPDMDPLWTLLDTTPEGRGNGWYPALSNPTT